MATDTYTHRLPQADEYYEKHVYNDVSTDVNRQELASDRDDYFPLQPIEKKLCGITFGLGVVLMALFVLSFELL